ncbi:glycosyltransferase family 32 protein [Jeotgalibaca ciconiae]|uniref:Glycosyl transferase n=1 Tax=Jeotgalibaca ciconiae TaxID=2496265 RepID=A0A3S9HDD0_9LACT|nr:glycosyltransferase [Jeotgalibaca ciconiae]AZP05385.1 glycosyl transferase [Jeotgalibaca ciconiae]HJB22740.1 glycosyl transferase [Candidatus Jeotgalibaca pullicola]
MIPKIIHYCWFGGNPIGEREQKVMESWKEYCPDYEIMEWNEDNFDVENMGNYVKEAYEEEKWAFVSDVARLYALIQYGGIYMDTDMEVIKPLDQLLKLDAFMGFEVETTISTAIIAAKPKHPTFQLLYDDYEDRHFKNEDGTLDEKTNVIRITEIFEEHGLELNNEKQEVMGVTIFPRIYFSPKSYWTQEINDGEETHTIHQYSGSWL